MKIKVKTALVSFIGIWALVMGAACQGAADSPETKPDAASNQPTNASVAGTVTYREPPGNTGSATLIVELRDVSHADSPATPIAQQTISDPGQGPIEFTLEYDREDIDPENRYAISASIVESDGSVAFINDTAHEVITQGNPDKVDMVLTQVEPTQEPTPETVEPTPEPVEPTPETVEPTPEPVEPTPETVEPTPEPVEDDENGEDGISWMEVLAPVVWANLIPGEPEPLLRVAYHQSAIENCARPGSQGLEVAGYDIIARVTLMQPATAGANSCDEEVVELDTVLAVGTPLEPGQTYRVMVNGVEPTTFSIPDPAMGPTVIAESPVESVEMLILEIYPAQYQLLVVSGMPRGSICSQFNGYEISRRSNVIEVAITHHEVADQEGVCTADYPIVETIVPLGSDFESGAEYTVRVNSVHAQTFVAQ